MLPISTQGRAPALASEVLITILPYPFFGLRIWARRLKKIPLGFNDYTLFLGLLFTTGLTVNSMISTLLEGYVDGYEQQPRPLTRERLSAEAEALGKISLSAMMLWPTAITFIKISVLHCYKNIFYSSRLMNYAIYALGAVVLAYWLSSVLLAFFIYHFIYLPILSYLSVAILNLLIDVMVVALPLPILWHLQMKTSKKISLMIIFSLGAVICVVSIVRCWEIAKVDWSDGVLSYSEVTNSTLTLLEPTLGCINACLVLLQPVASKVSRSPLFKYFKKVRPSHGRIPETQSRGNFTPKQFNRLPPDPFPLTEFNTTIQGSQKSGLEHTLAAEEQNVGEIV